MKFYRKLRLVLGCTAAFGWFILRDIPYTSILPIIPLGVVYYVLTRNMTTNLFLLNGVTAGVTAVVAAYAVAAGLFEGEGVISLICLLAAVGVGAIGISKTELSRISGWWIIGFIAVYVLMFIATLPGISLRVSLPKLSGWWDVLILYLLAFMEPFGMGREYRGAPIILGILLIPFGVAAYLALGAGAFSMAEYPYLSVWSGVAVSAFHHLEGIILCFYYGLSAFRIAYFLLNLKKSIAFI